MTPEETAALRSQGFGITTNSDPDLFESFLQRYMSVCSFPKNAAQKKAQQEQLQNFVNFCKEQLIANPPIAMTFLDNGMALQFQDYSRIVLVKAPEKGNNSSGAVAIAEADKKGGPIVYRQIDTSVPITR